MRQGFLPMVVVTVPDNAGVTARAGVILVHETLRALGVPKLVKRHVRIQKRSGTHSDFTKIEDLMMNMAIGGDCIEDIRVLAADQGLWRLLGRGPASPESLRQFLYEFHDERLVAAAAQAAKEKNREAYIVEENEYLQGLGRVMTEMVRQIAEQQKIRRATLDHDATIQESHKQEAKAHYKHGRGYQPAAVYWNEADVVIADEYRDGNVPAGMDNLALIMRAFASLPRVIVELHFRADTACYEARVLAWLANEQREGGPQGHIGFTIGADMTAELRAVCEKVPETAWTLMEERGDETVWCTEVEFTPGDHPKSWQPLRYVAVRIRKRQGELFKNGSDTKYLAVVTNKSGEPAALLRWHWKKAGTIEMVHDVMKNELGAGVPPCGRFGANAAWYRLSAMTYNVLSALKTIALPAVFESARPKRLRAMVLTLPGRIVSHAGHLLLQLGKQAEAITGFIAARQRLLAFANPLAPAPAPA